ncbi:proline-rich receptor-like protein kinase PERK2 [Neltuma alba]|uniref:proline-rich receptor-like protein kinase PERK2 n=1 Tax=Neltuma alba TaxID=207710 RepID=UPI0010A552E1|nr:proline-rich receptor-like protein kinase PERK2 [Prosopis alba]
MVVLEKEVSQRFDYVEREIRDLKGMVASLCNNFSALSTSFSFEDLLSHPPSPPHPEPEPPTSPIPTSPTSTSPSVPSTSPTPPPATLALITAPQPIPSLTLPPISQAVSLLSQLPPIPISITLPTASLTPSLVLGVGLWTSWAILATPVLGYCNCVMVVVITAAIAVSLSCS